MPRRPRSHQLEAEARRQLKEIFDGGEGWSINDLHEDYGEDLLVRIFQQQKATPLSFYVQSKATDSIARFRKKTLRFSVPLSKTHLQHWAGFWEPVFLTLYDSRSRKTYWECGQTFLETQFGSARFRKKHKTLTVDVPEANILDRHGVKRILNITKVRFQRHHDEKIGTEALLSLLEERAGLRTVGYDPRAGILLMEDHKKQKEHVFFGKAGELVGLLTQDHQDQNEIYNAIIMAGLNHMQKTIKIDSKTGTVTILDDNGLVREQHATLEDWHLSERIKTELRGPDEKIRIVRRLRRQLSKRIRSRPRA